jgi:hypothetical protein
MHSYPETLSPNQVTEFVLFEACRHLVYTKTISKRDLGNRHAKIKRRLLKMIIGIFEAKKSS